MLCCCVYFNRNFPAKNGDIRILGGIKLHKIQPIHTSHYGIATPCSGLEGVTDRTRFGLRRTNYKQLPRDVPVFRLSHKI